MIIAICGFSGIYAETGVPSLSVGDTWVYGLPNQVTGEVVQPYAVTIDRMEDYQGVSCYVWATEYSESQLEEWITIEEGDWTILKLNHNIYVADEIALQTYSPGLKLFDFPLSVGKEWSGESNVTLTVTRSTGETLGNESFMLSWHRKVVSVKSITVPAGTFDTYLVEETTAHDGVDDVWCQYWYFCNNVNNWVKHEHYDPHADQLYFEGDLMSYDVAVQGDGEGDDQVNGQEDVFSGVLIPLGLVVLVVVIAVIVFIYYRRRRTTKAT